MNARYAFHPRLPLLRRLTYTYDDLRTRFPLVSMVRTVEFAGNRRVLFGVAVRVES